MQKVRPYENQRYVVETITMTTVTERRIVRQANENVPSGSHGSVGGIPTTGIHQAATAAAAAGVAGNAADPGDRLNDATSISGILKGGKLWKSEQTQVRFATYDKIIPNSIFHIFSVI